MFERFTEDARQVVVSAQEQARTLNHNYIGTEHVLLGLLAVDGIAARALESFDVTLGRARSEVVQHVGHGEAEAGSGQVPFTPRAKKVLELSLREALTLGDQHIGSEHILLGMVREGEGVAARILLDLGATPDAVRQAVVRLLGLPRYPVAATAAAWAGGRAAVRQPIDLAWFGGAGTALSRLASEIRQELGREPDPGDLLLVLARSSETLAGPALRELGVDPDALWATIERLRGDLNRQLSDVADRIREAAGGQGTGDRDASARARGAAAGRRAEADRAAARGDEPDARSAGRDPRDAWAPESAGRPVVRS